MAIKQLILAGLILQVVCGSLFFLFSFNAKLQGPAVTVKQTRQSPSCPPPSSSCAPPEASNNLEYDTFLLVLILSEKDKVAERQAARDTWMSKVADNKKRTMVKFIVGIEEWNTDTVDMLSPEVKKYNDLAFVYGLRKGFEGNNLRIIFKWAKTNVRFKYLMKVEDNVYVMIEKLVRSLEGADSSFPLIWGRILHNSDKFISENVKSWSYTNFRYSVPLPMSPGYVMTGSIVHALPIDERNTPAKTYPHEGTTLGLWLSMFNIEYRTLNVYIHSEEKPLCPKDKSAVMMYQYAYPMEGFHKLHMCLHIEESWFNQDHKEPVKLVHKRQLETKPY